MQPPTYPHSIKLRYAKLKYIEYSLTIAGAFPSKSSSVHNIPSIRKNGSLLKKYLSVNYQQ